ncbi:hypothetical protein PBCV1_a162aR [Paramecium bursaria Chlorella virus 1]|uniref:Uncharacterized protein n=1 Tax=Paramecium bursaria Chlorella virus 1 TaxID=10506 RepID=F8TTY6_PBCV1|nr:hypothetical protein PBCV1_a162aR [Paramecium bursaria Chlorella virus 1]AEI70047.1 hypothetical protein [Paramecium bursaria Chlorella virus 1]
MFDTLHVSPMLHHASEDGMKHAVKFVSVLGVQSYILSISSIY